jgi:DNA-binding HxlR family transcriptional regulator
MPTKTYHCPVEATIDVIGGKWKALILWWLQQRTWRFAELRRQIPGITEKMLTQQLRELEADGIVARQVYPTVPPKVEYSLTDYGRSLKRALREICEWGQQHMKRIGAVQISFDRACAPGAKNDKGNGSQGRVKDTANKSRVSGHASGTARTPTQAKR